MCDEARTVNPPLHYASASATGGVKADVAERAISRALGEELRRAREACGWSRAQLAGMLPSGIGDRTILSYEHGTRHLTVLRLIEMCRTLGVAADTVVAHALQRARIHLENLNLRIDLHAMLRDSSDKFRPMAQWARNKLNESPDGIAELAPAAVRELATFVGYTDRELANYLARFVPDTEPVNSE